MNVQTTRLRIMTEARSLARRLGLIGPLRSAVQIARGLRGKVAYEEKFDAALTQAVRPGDTVLDVGANIGLYSSKFIELVGPTGVVYSVEPVPTCFAALESNCIGYPNSFRFPLALGEAESTVTMSLDGDPLGATHSLVNPKLAASGRGSVDVRVMRGDTLLKENGLKTPNVIKVDVEGYEEEVIHGLDSTLSRPECRALLCEVHFALLEAKGARQAPSRIQKFLEEKGFKVRWTDSSHLAAERVT